MVPSVNTTRYVWIEKQRSFIALFSISPERTISQQSTPLKMFSLRQDLGRQRQTKGALNTVVAEGWDI